MFLSIEANVAGILRKNRMLIEFSIANFRSIRERQTLSMVAASRLRKKENLFEPTVNGEKFPSLLKVVAIYGPNASGKSNLIRAFDTVSKILRRSPTADALPLPVAPFRFDPELLDKPSQFELNFIQNETRYTFTLAATSERIYNERLVSYSRGREVFLYNRLYENRQEHYDFGNQLEGGKDLHEAWRKLTGPQVLFISQAVANSNEELKQLRIPFEWLSTGSMVVTEGMREIATITQRLIADLPQFGEGVAKLLHDVDVPISAITVKVLDSGEKSSAATTETIDVENSKQKLGILRSRADVKTTLTHKTSLGEADFDFDDESEGTKNIFGFTLPWLMLQEFSKNSNYRILVVDELDSSLHPKIVESLIERHLSSNLSCQLIFTTHDTHLMDTKLLRRDQFWMTERDAAGATQLRSVHDFDGREGEDIEKRYFEGRYRSLPLVRKG